MQSLFLKPVFSNEPHIPEKGPPLFGYSDSVALIIDLLCSLLQHESEPQTTLLTLKLP